MVLYFGTIIIGQILIILYNCFFVVPVSSNLTYLKASLLTVGLTLTVIAIDGVFAAIVHNVLPASWFAWDSKRFDVSKKEKKFLKLIGVKKWKDKVLDLGQIACGFSKSKIADPENPEYIKLFIKEANYGAVVHICDVFFGFLLLFFFPSCIYNITLPIAIVNAFLNLLPIFVQRYNHDRLLALLRVLEIKKSRQKSGM